MGNRKRKKDVKSGCELKVDVSTLWRRRKVRKALRTEMYRPAGAEGAAQALHVLEDAVWLLP